jgi:hypothetical protein
VRPDQGRPAREALHLPGIGELFHSYDEAWAHFLARDEPLESFWAALPDDPDATLRLSVIVPPDEVKAAARAVQDSFADLEWVAAVPDYFLHVSAHSTWANVVPFEVVYRRANCFHDAAIVEAHVDGDAAPPPPFLPHLSIGYFRRSERPGHLREALMPFREIELGSGIVDEVLVCDVPIAKTTILDPWTVVERIPLGERAV